ncbi:hypothetical protein RAH57_17275 [Chryseobacterium sp. CKR4-1]|uniref:hypothetical protein n=1 Tax=Chryseobacterium sp. CKR4-1 TaxID=3068896 RepID=UPI0027964038|nr:hypothetical protein [Chryseobacterium sp. CKR4-1]MDQ1805746.1 hypothetical protein [Chryseobacterium sp. CKR4-1]
MKNIKYFNQNELKNISYDKIFLCVEMYEADKNLKNKRKIELNYDITLKINRNGYIEITNFASVDKNGNSGVIYIKKRKIKIDLITLLSDRSGTITTYNVKFIDNYMYLLEDRFIGSDYLSYLIFKLQ